jgi:hypothetical protein
MAVQQIDEKFGVDGHAKSVAAFRRAHHENSEGILNAAEGKPTDAPRPTYDPAHVDNQWPVMLHHAVKGELPVGKNLKGVMGSRERSEIVAANETAFDAAIAQGYREEPYLKPQIYVMDPAAEKAALVAKIADLEGTIVAQNDSFEKRLLALEAPPVFESKKVGKNLNEKG